MRQFTLDQFKVFLKSKCFFALGQKIPHYLSSPHSAIGFRCCQSHSWEDRAEAWLTDALCVYGCTQAGLGVRSTPLALPLLKGH